MEVSAQAAPLRTGQGRSVAAAAGSCLAPYEWCTVRIRVCLHVYADAEHENSHGMA